MNYFQTFTQVAQIKTEYHRLAKLYHPDIGGDTAIMQTINFQYQSALENCNGQTSTSNGKTHTYKYNADIEQAIMDKIAEILGAKLDGIDLWLIGTWIWVDGNTKPHKKVLGKGTEEQPGLKLKWHSKRKKWYWHNNGYQRRYNSKASFDQMANAYGVTHFENDRTEKALA